VSFATVLKFFTSPWGIALLAVVGALGYSAFVYHKGESAGGAAVTAKVQQKTIQTQRKIDDAEAHGPRTPHDVSRRMRDGSF
jgi:hypothetical protein